MPFRTALWQLSLSAGSARTSKNTRLFGIQLRLRPSSTNYLRPRTNATIPSIPKSQAGNYPTELGSPPPPPRIQHNSTLASPWLSRMLGLATLAPYVTKRCCLGPAPPLHLIPAPLLRLLPVSIIMLHGPPTNRSPPLMTAPTARKLFPRPPLQLRSIHLIAFLQVSRLLAPFPTFRPYLSPHHRRVPFSGNSLPRFKGVPSELPEVRLGQIILLTINSWPTLKLSTAAAPSNLSL